MALGDVLSCAFFCFVFVSHKIRAKNENSSLLFCLREEQNFPSRRQCWAFCFMVEIFNGGGLVNVSRGEQHADQTSMNFMRTKGKTRRRGHVRCCCARARRRRGYALRKERVGQRRLIGCHEVSARAAPHSLFVEPDTGAWFTLSFPRPARCKAKEERLSCTPYWSESVLYCE